MKTKPKPFGQRLRELRQAASLTQEQLAERLGTSKAHVSQLETGYRGAGWELACRIADALEVGVQELRG